MDMTVMTNDLGHVTSIPDSDHKDEQQSKQYKTNVAPYSIEGRENTKRMCTLEVVIALILISTQIYNLKHKEKW